MAHAIIRGANGRRHEVDFEGVEITVEVFFGDETVEIAVEAPEESDTFGQAARCSAERATGAVRQGSGRRCAPLEESSAQRSWKREGKAPPVRNYLEFPETMKAGSYVRKSSTVT